MSYYSLESTINQFFSGRPVTQKDCDRAAVQLTGESVEPVKLQGAFSYTVAAGNQIVQFRVSESPLDTNILALAREIYGSVVPSCLNSGVIGPSPPLTVYVMEKVPGRTYIETPSTTLHCTQWQQKTVLDFAKFFAKSWRHQLLEPYHSEYSLIDLQHKLDTLARQLPSRFMTPISKIREELPLLFSPTYPLVLSHGDLCEMNIIVDHEAGGITGIIDWAEAKVLPFGMSLWGFLNMLGFMNSSGWYYYDISPQLESLFWETFYKNIGEISCDHRRAIRVAERAGIVLRYGFTWDNGVRERPVTEQDSSFRYLEAFLPRLEG